MVGLKCEGVRSFLGCMKVYKACICVANEMCDV